MTNSDIVPGFDDDDIFGLAIELGKANNLDHCLVVTITGEINMWTYSRFLSRIQKAIDAGFYKLILVGLRYIGTPASGTLVQLRKQALSLGGDFVIVAFPLRKEIEALYGIPLFKFLDSLEEAMQYLSGPSSFTW